MRRHRPRRAAVGIDLGGTYTKLAWVTPEGRVLQTRQLPSLPGRGPERYVRRICSRVRLWERASGRGLAAGGLGLAGDVDAERGTLRFSPNLKPFIGFDFRTAFQKRLGVPVAVDNDANMAAWGGYVLELGRRLPNVVCLTLGTGVGGGIVLGGSLYRGGTGTAGEIGHLCVEPDGELCHCGARGCLEAYVGAYGIVRSAVKLLEGPSGAGSLLRRFAPDYSGLEPKVLASAARRGDPAASNVWRVTAHYLGIGVSCAVVLLNPDAVLLTGGVARAADLLLPPLRRALSKQPFRTPFRRARLVFGRVPDLGAVGAALQGLEHADS